MIIQCSWCGATLGEKEPFENTEVTHTICPDCEVKFFEVKQGMQCVFSERKTVDGKWLKIDAVMPLFGEPFLVLTDGVSGTDLFQCSPPWILPNITRDALIIQARGILDCFDEGQLEDRRIEAQVAAIERTKRCK